jgi:hypothetical protein
VHARYLLGAGFTAAVVPLLLGGCSSSSLTPGGATPGGATSSAMSSGAASPMVAIREARRAGSNMILPIHERARRSVPPAHTWFAAGPPPNPLLYVSDYSGNFVNIYSANGSAQTPIGQITGFNEPQGLWVDINQNLWVVNTNTEQIIGFHRGAASPFKTFNDTSGNFPVGVCGNNNKNLMYVVDIVGPPPYYDPANTIEVYNKAGSASPIETLTDSNASALYQCAVDSKGNLFVTLTNIDSNLGEVDEFPKGSTAPTVIANNLVYALGITVDKYNALAVDDTYAYGYPYTEGEVYIYDPPYTNGPAYQFEVPSGIDQTALNKQQTQLWGSNAFALDAQQYSYPLGVLQNSTSTQDFEDPSGVALSPAAKQ